jgi:hypothetical protein
VGWYLEYKPDDLSAEAYLKQRLGALDVAVVQYYDRPVAFAAIDGEDGVFALVCILTDESTNDDGYAPHLPDGETNFGFKPVEEFAGPFRVDCPRRILERLTPTDHEAARAWREAAWDALATSEAVEARAAAGELVPITHYVWVDPPGAGAAPGAVYFTSFAEADAYARETAWGILDALVADAPPSSSGRTGPHLSGAAGGGTYTVVAGHADHGGAVVRVKPYPDGVPKRWRVRATGHVIDAWGEPS